MIAPSLLRLRSDEQLVALFRAGHDEAFSAIHDRYRQRLFAYTRQMLPRRQDAEDVLQDVFVRAYANLRSSDRELALRAWLYRVAHNRCIDELRRPHMSAPEAPETTSSVLDDPIAQADQRESLRRLVADVRRLPDQQRSALLMRELSGMPYADMAAVLGVSVSAVKSLLVRARLALARASEARDTACSEIREELIVAHDRRVRPGGTARRHIRDCAGCRDFRRELRGVSRELTALVPAIGPLAGLAKLLGLGGGAGSGAAAGGGVAVAGGVAGTTGAFASVGVVTGTAHVATLLAAAVVAAGGAVEIQHTIAPPVHHRSHHHRVLARRPRPPAATPPAYVAASAQTQGYTAPVALIPAPPATPSPPPPSPARVAAAAKPTPKASADTAQSAAQSAASSTGSTALAIAAGATSTATGPGGGASSSSAGSSSSTSTSSTGTGSTPSTPDQSTAPGSGSTTTDPSQSATASGSGDSSTGTSATQPGSTGTQDGSTSSSTSTGDTTATGSSDSSTTAGAPTATATN